MSGGSYREKQPRKEEFRLSVWSGIEEQRGRMRGEGGEGGTKEGKREGRGFWKDPGAKGAAGQTAQWVESWVGSWLTSLCIPRAGVSREKVKYPFVGCGGASLGYLLCLSCVAVFSAGL